MPPPSNRSRFKDTLSYLAIDTLELGDRERPHGAEAADLSKRLVEGQRVVLKRDFSDKGGFGRLLRFVYVDGILVNAEPIRFTVTKGVECGRTW